MSTINEKISFLKGLMSGLKIDAESKDGMLWNAVIDVLGEVSDELEDVQDVLDDLGDELEEVSDDLEDLMDEFYDDDDDDDDDEEDEGYIDFICPSCGRHVMFDVESFSADEEHKCPCGASLFSEDEDE